MSYPIKQSSTQGALLFFLTLSSDHISPATGLSPTVTLSKNGAAFASPSGAVSEIANGWYKVAANATDTATLGPLALHASVATADNCDMIVAHIVAYDPQDSVRLGLTALPNAAAAASGGLYIRGTGAGAINQDANGRIDVNAVAWLGTACATPVVNGIPLVMTGLMVRRNTAQTGAASTITLDASATALHCERGDLIFIESGTGALESNTVLSFSTSTKIATMVQNWTTNPDNTSIFQIWKTGGIAPATVANVQASILLDATPFPGATIGAITLVGGRVDSNVGSVASVAVQTSGSGTQNIGGP